MLQNIVFEPKREIKMSQNKVFIIFENKILHVTKT